MKVSEIVAKLLKCNQDALVITYSADSEDASICTGVTPMGNPYTKGGTCEEIANGKEYVVIG
jgi:hypothetical protein